MPEVDKDLRSMAFYLGALLSIDSFKLKIVKALQENNEPKEEGYLLIGLAALTKPEEFDSLIKDIKVNKISASVARLYYYLNKGSEKERRAAAVEIVNRRQKFLLKDAINYLIDINDADALARHWQAKDQSVRALVGKAGYSMMVTRKGAKFVEKSVENLESSKTDADDFAKACTKQRSRKFGRHCGSSDAINTR